MRLRIDLKRFIFPMLIAISAMLFIGASCSKKDGGTTDPDGLVKAIDAASTPPKAIDRTPVPGVDVSKLEDKAQTLFFEMVDSLSSPCGKAHSLRTSVTTDKECKRAPFAAKYLLLLVEAGAPKDVVKEFYGLHYDKIELAKFDVDETMEHIGPPDAVIKIVEFFDYGCPHCAEFLPVIEESIAAFPDDVVIYFKHYVLGKFVGSELAAQGAIAAGKQGRFHDMHVLLFAKQSMAGHTKEKVFKYAESLKLDMKKFAADFDEARAQVEMDHSLGRAVGVESTPAIFINGRDYKGPAAAEFMKLWLEEELAVNR